MKAGISSIHARYMMGYVADYTRQYLAGSHSFGDIQSVISFFLSNQSKVKNVWESPRFSELVVRYRKSKSNLSFQSAKVDHHMYYRRRESLEAPATAHCHVEDLSCGVVPVPSASFEWFQHHYTENARLRYPHDRLWIRNTRAVRSMTR